MALVKNAEPGVTAYSRLLDAMGTIGSDFEMSEAMLAIAENMPRDPGLLEKYRKTARGLSRFEQEKVLEAIE